MKVNSAVEKSSSQKNVTFTHHLQLGPTSLFSALGTIPILRQQRDWVGGVRKMVIFADFSFYADLVCVGGSENVKQIAEVI